MKICLINSLYKPYSRGGAEVVFDNIINGLQAAGHKVVVITIKPFQGLFSLWPDNNRIPLTPFDKGAVSTEVFPELTPIKGGEGDVYRFYPLNIFSFINISRHNIFCRLIWHKLDVFNLHSYFVVRNILQKEKPDMVMTHNLKGIGYLVPWAIKRSKIKWLHTVHDVQLSTPGGLIIKDQENNLEQRIFLKKWYEKICRFLFDSPDVVISPSKWLMDFYSEKGFFKNSKKLIIPNPVIISLPSKMAESRQQQTVNLLYLGQIEEHKGVPFLVNTFKDFLKYQTQNTKYQLLIAGDGSRLEEIKKIAADEPRIKILGRVPHEKINEVLSQADFTIVPSLCYENSPGVIYESFSFGVPVIAAKIGGVAELVEDGINGFTFEAGDEEDLLRVLKLSIENRGQDLRQNALNTVKGLEIEEYIAKLLNN